MSNTQELEAQIDSLIDEATERREDYTGTGSWLPRKKDVERLGRLCGKLAVAACYTDDSRPEEWEPADGDIDALEELFGQDPYEEGLATGDEVFFAFNGAYKEGVAEAVEGRHKISEACDDLDDVI